MRYLAELIHIISLIPLWVFCFVTRRSMVRMWDRIDRCWHYTYSRKWGSAYIAPVHWVFGIGETLLYKDMSVDKNYIANWEYVIRRDDYLSDQYYEQDKSKLNI